MTQDFEEQITEAFRSFTILERTLRQVVGEALSDHFGLGWEKQIPKSIRDDCDSKMQRTLDVDIGPERDKNLLSYTDFSQLTAIVDYHWDKIFHTWFSDKQITIGRFEEIRSYRNALMHSVLHANDCPVFINLCRELMSQLNNAPGTMSTVKPLSSYEAAPIHTADRPFTQAQQVFHQKISAVLSEMSGLFEGERDALLEHIKNNLRLCTSGLLEQVRYKFFSLPDTNRKVQTLLSQLPPDKPEPPNPKKWGIKTPKWFKWVVNSYLPYRYWMIMNDQVDEELEQICQIYEDWLYSSYPKLLSRPEQFVYGSYKHIDALLERHLVLWVLIDNFPFFFQEFLVKHLREYGFRIEKIDRQFAMLPSETNISRKSALTGRLPGQIPENISEIDALKDSWRDRTAKSMVYIERPSDFENIDQYQADLFIYVYGWLDKLAHTADSKDFDRESQVDAALSQLVGKLFVAMTQLTQLGPAKLVISTDHGSTSLRRQGERLAVPQSAVKDATYEEHRRFIRVSNKAPINSVEWFFLDKEQFGLHHNYAVARGWRFVESCPRGFTHGGLSPEETVVPMFTCELGDGEVERLQPIYEHANEPLRLGRPSKLAVRVRNPYKMSIESLKITLADYGQTFPPIDIEPQLDAVTDIIEFQLPAKMPVEQNVVFLNITVEFTAGGERHSQMEKLRVRVSQLFKTDLDDEFGAMFS